MNLEQDLREMMRARADAFAPSPQPRDFVLPRARVRTMRSMLATTLLIAGAVFVGTTLDSGVTPDQRAFAAFTVQRASDAQNDAVPSHERPAAGEPITRAMLEENVECMRARGLNLPDPMRTPQGWQVIVEDSAPLPSESPDLNVRKRWAQGVFVDCRLLDLTDDLVLGGRTRQQVDAFMACARAKGFVLPQPSESKTGQFVFDLDAASPPLGTEAWYQTLFVTCGLWRLGLSPPSS